MRWLKTWVRSWHVGNAHPWTSRMTWPHWLVMFCYRRVSSPTSASLTTTSVKICKVTGRTPSRKLTSRCLRPCHLLSSSLSHKNVCCGNHKSCRMMICASPMPSLWNDTSGTRLWSILQTKPWSISWHTTRTKRSRKPRLLMLISLLESVRASSTVCPSWSRTSRR